MGTTKKTMFETNMQTAFPKVVISSYDVQGVLDGYRQTKAEKPDSMPGFSRQEEDCEDKPLTPGDSFRPSYREIQLMAYVAEGYTNKEIAQRLYISESAVKKLFMRLLRRSGLRNRAHVAAYAAHKGYTVD